MPQSILPKQSETASAQPSGLLLSLFVYAPAKFLGDLSGYQGGTLAFDAKNLNGEPPSGTSSPLFGTITITGAGGTASAVLGGTGQPAADSLWHTYSISMTSALWTGNLAGALSNTTQFSVVLESNDAIVESNGFDNFRLTPANTVPEPGALALLLADGLAGAGLFARRRRK